MDSSRSLLLALACVAAFATACSSGSADPKGAASPTSSEQGTLSPSKPPASTAPVTPSGYDELKNWSTGETDASMTAVGKIMGVDNLTFPAADYVDAGWVGVAPFEQYCIIAFRSVGKQPAKDMLGVAVLSRYNTRLDILIEPGTPQQLKPAINKAREYCKSAVVTLPPQATTTI